MRLPRATSAIHALLTVGAKQSNATDTLPNTRFSVLTLTCPPPSSSFFLLSPPLFPPPKPNKETKNTDPQKAKPPFSDPTFPPAMGVSPIYASLLLLLIISPQISLSSSPQINSNSILVALLDSPYTELSELIEKALLLPTLESVLSHHNLTIFAPTNLALELDLSPDFKLFLLQPRNLPSLQSLLLSHFLPSNSPSSSLSGHPLSLSLPNFVDSAHISLPNHILRPDGLIHGIDHLLIPLSVQHSFNLRRNLASVSALLPSGAPIVDPRTHRLKKPAPPSPAGSAPALPIYDALAPGPSLSPAPAPGPGGPHGHFHGHALVQDFIHTLLHYGGYNELADILMNLTSLGAEMGRLVSEGYVITVLAPNDEAMAKLTTDQLSEPGAPEQIMYYHMIPEYQTEESMYNAVRRFGKVKYDTLRLPFKMTAEEADGSVKFGQGDASAYLFDPDIYTDGRISVQGIDGVLFPLEESKVTAGDAVSTTTRPAKVVTKSRRGKLMEVTCLMLRTVRQDSRFTNCL